MQDFVHQPYLMETRKGILKCPLSRWCVGRPSAPVGVGARLDVVLAEVPLKGSI